MAAKKVKPIVKQMCRWTLRWGDPSTSPPAGKPRVVAEELFPLGVTPEIDIASDKAGQGYVLAAEVVNVVTWPRRQLVRRAGRPRRASKPPPHAPASLFESETTAA
jgi:hypothetical protein